MDVLFFILFHCDLTTKLLFIIKFIKNLEKLNSNSKLNFLQHSDAHLKVNERLITKNIYLELPFHWQFLANNLLHTT